MLNKNDVLSISKNAILKKNKYFIFIFKTNYFYIIIFLYCLKSLLDNSYLSILLILL